MTALAQMCYSIFMKNSQQKRAVAFETLERLKDGNKEYVNAKSNTADVSPERRRQTVENGQHPYAVIVSCSDSRVIPESIFSAGIGDLFVIRVAGNVVDSFQLGSIEYAVEHLGCRLVVVLGHTHCGAVGAAHGHNCGYVRTITDEIKSAIGDETDMQKASILNVKHSVSKIQSHLQEPDLLVVGALYMTDTGVVKFDI